VIVTGTVAYPDASTVRCERRRLSRSIARYTAERATPNGRLTRRCCAPRYGEARPGALPGSPCPTSSSTPPLAATPAQWGRLSVRSCSVTTGRPARTPVGRRPGRAGEVSGRFQLSYSRPYLEAQW